MLSSSIYGCRMPVTCLLASGSVQALHRARLDGETMHLQAEGPDGGVRLWERAGRQVASRLDHSGRGKGAFFTAAVNTPLSLQHGLNHLDKKSLNLDSGLRMHCFSR